MGKNGLRPTRLPREHEAITAYRAKRLKVNAVGREHVEGLKIGPPKTPSTGPILMWKTENLINQHGVKNAATKSKKS